MLFLSKHRFQLHGNILVFLVAYRPTNANILVRVPGSAASNSSINAAALVYKHISITERAPEFWVVRHVNGKAHVCEATSTPQSQTILFEFGCILELMGISECPGRRPRRSSHMHMSGGPAAHKHLRISRCALPIVPPFC